MREYIYIYEPHGNKREKYIDRIFIFRRVNSIAKCRTLKL